jgi:hypothetical protein
MTTTPQNRAGGILLIIGTFLVVGTTFLTPGIAIIDFVDADDFIGMSRVVSENTSLTFLTTMLGVLGFILQLYGVLVLRRGVMGHNTVDTIARFGVMAFAVGNTLSVIDRAVLFTATHTLKYGIGGGAGPDQEQLLSFIAVILLKAQTGLGLMAFFAFLMGSIGLGVGFIGKVHSTSYRVVAIIMMPACFVSLVFVSVISPLYGLAGSFFLLFAVAVLLGHSWLVMLAAGLYRGMPELSVVDEQT